MKKLQKKLKEILSHAFIPRYSNNQRSKLLHPAGLSVVVGIFLLNFAMREMIIVLPGFVLGFSSSVTVEEVISLTNQERTAAGLNALTQDPNLTQAAYAKAVDMFAKDYWAHVSPIGTQPWFFIKNTGYTYRHAGENLARDFSDSSSLVKAWMNSSSHRDNLMNTKYQDIGVAVVDGTLQGVETRLVVQMFGTPTPIPVAAAPQPVQSKISQTAPETVQLPQEQALQVQEEVTIEQKELESLQEEVVPEATEELAIELVETNFGKAVIPDPQEQFTGTRILQAIGGPETVVKVSPTQITYTFGLMLVTLILGTLVIDWVIAHRKRSVRLVGRNWAHLTFLGAVILVIFQYAQGRIL